MNPDTTNEVGSKAFKHHKFKPFRSPLKDLNNKGPSNSQSSSQNVVLDLEGMKMHISNCNVTININKN